MTITFLKTMLIVKVVITEWVTKGYHTFAFSVKKEKSIDKYMNLSIFYDLFHLREALLGTL